MVLAEKPTISGARDEVDSALLREVGGRECRTGAGAAAVESCRDCFYVGIACSACYLCVQTMLMVARWSGRHKAPC